MKHIHIEVRNGFHVVAETKKSQAATMAIEPGESEGGPDNSHDADQWLYVIEGNGQAIVEGQAVNLKAGSLLQIPAGERHEIKCTGKQTLRTLNIYAPPEY